MRTFLYNWLALISIPTLSVDASLNRNRYKCRKFGQCINHHQHLHPRDIIRLHRPELMFRGGSTTLRSTSKNDKQNEDVDEYDIEDTKGEAPVDPEEEKKRIAIQKWKMDQQNLMQLRSVYLSEELAKRGIPLPTLMDVSTSDGEKPPEKVDWDCAMCTEDEPKSCLYSFDAEPNTKVIAPISTTEWISLAQLNTLRRTDPSKVEPMWHSKYSILQSWFDDNSEFTLFQHVGVKGLLFTLLLDSGNGLVLTSLLILSMFTMALLFMPVIEFFANRLLVSGLFWSYWPTWGRIAHAALPLKLLIGQMAWKFIARAFNKLESKIRYYIVDIESAILEESTPLTVGPGSEDPLYEDVELLESEDYEGDEEIDFDYEE